jgi:hypothetical protein
MSSPVDLTGRWVGHYLQHDRERPITADLIQSGERLAGAMCDGHLHSEHSLFEIAQEAGLPPGADEQIEANLREALPDAPAGPIRYVRHLPPESVLEGRCKGPVVSFLKTYQGTCFDGYQVGEQLLGMEKAGHAVHYEGRLTPDGRTIDGRWWIEADPEEGTGRTEGYFTLRRGPGDQPSFREQTPAPVRPHRPWWRFWSS